MGGGAPALRASGAEGQCFRMFVGGAEGTAKYIVGGAESTSKYIPAYMTSAHAQSLLKEHSYESSCDERVACVCGQPSLCSAIHEP